MGWFTLRTRPTTGPEILLFPVTSRDQVGKTRGIPSTPSVFPGLESTVADSVLLVDPGFVGVG